MNIDLTKLDETIEKLEKIKKLLKEINELEERRNDYAPQPMPYIPQQPKTNEPWPVWKTHKIWCNQEKWDPDGDRQQFKIWC